MLSASRSEPLTRTAAPAPRFFRASIGAPLWGAPFCKIEKKNIDKKRKIKFRTGDAKDIAQTMQEHTLRLQAQRKADRAQKQQSLRDGAPDFAPTPLGDIGEDSSTDDENVGEYRVLNFCQVIAKTQKSERWFLTV